jgi:hypothetical protein
MRTNQEVREDLRELLRLRRESAYRPHRRSWNERVEREDEGQRCPSRLKPLTNIKPS